VNIQLVNWLLLIGFLTNLHDDLSVRLYFCNYGDHFHNSCSHSF